MPFQEKLWAAEEWTLSITAWTNTGQKIPQMSVWNGSNHICGAQTVIGQHFAGNGPNGQSYYYYFYYYYYYYVPLLPPKCPSNHMILIHSVHISKPSHHSMIHSHSTCQLPFHSSSFMHLSIHDSIHSWHSQIFSNTSSQEHPFSVTQQFSYQTLWLHTIPLVQLLLHIQQSLN